MPLRRRSRSATDAVSPKTIPINKRTSKLFLHNLVKPRCVEHRPFYVDICNNDRGFMFTISEAIRANTKSHTSYQWSHRHVLLDRSEIAAGVESRLIGTPTVIACRREHLILQCVMDKQPCIKFIYVNLATHALQIIPDDVQYFPRDLVWQRPVECHLSTDLSCALFTLPHNTMTVQRTSKVLSASAVLKPGGNLHFKAISEWVLSNLRVNKRTALIFNPRRPCEVLVAKAAIYGRICSLSTVNLSADNPKLECKVRVPIEKSIFAQAGKYGRELSCGLQMPDRPHSQDLNLQQCDVDYSKSGDILLFSMCSIVMDLNQLQIKCVLFAADTWDILKNVWFFPDPSIPSGHGLKSGMFVFHTDNEDSRLSVWYRARGSAPQAITCHVKLPRELSLQAVCRTVIREHCLPQDLHVLPLPQKLSNYVQFRQDWAQ